MRPVTPTLTLAAMATALLTGCGAEVGPTADNTTGLTADAADQNTAHHFKSVEPFTEPLVNPCNGETIVFSGVAVVQINGDRDGLHFEFFTSAEGTGTGPESGATYTYHLDAAHENNNWSPDRLHATFTGGANARIISDLPGLSFTAHFVFHGVLLPSGEFKVTRSLDRVECKR